MSHGQALAVCACRLLRAQAVKPSESAGAAAAATRRWVESPLLARWDSTEALATPPAHFADPMRSALNGDLSRLDPEDMHKPTTRSILRASMSIYELRNTRGFTDCLDSSCEAVRDAQLLAAAAAAHAVGGGAALSGSAALRTLAAVAAKNMRFMHIAARARAAREAAEAEAAPQGEEAAERAGSEAHEKARAAEAAAVAARAAVLLCAPAIPQRPPAPAAASSDAAASDADAAAAAACSEAHLLLCLDAPASDLAAALAAEARRRAHSAQSLADVMRTAEEMDPDLRAAALSVAAEADTEELLACSRAPGGAEAVRALLHGAAGCGLAHFASAPQACRVLSRALGPSTSPELLSILSEASLPSRLRRLLSLPLVGDDAPEAGTLLKWDGEGSDMAAWEAAGLLIALVWQARKLPSPHLSLA